WPFLLFFGIAKTLAGRRAVASPNARCSGFGRDTLRHTESGGCIVRKMPIGYAVPRMTTPGCGYRDPAEGFAPPDHEALAAHELGRRAARLHKMIVVPSLVSGIVVGVALYLLLREVQFGLFGRHIPWVTGFVAIG